MSYGQTPLSKGVLFRTYEDAVVDEFVFQYNPTRLRETVGANWNYTESPGQFLPVASFENFGNRTISFELLMYGREGRNIEVDKSRLEMFVSPGPPFGLDSPQFVSPGSAILNIGHSLWDVKVDSIDFGHEMFDRQLRSTVILASVSLTVVSSGLEADVQFMDSIRRKARLEG